MSKFSNICIFLFALVSLQNCSISNKTVSAEPIYHFGESPCEDSALGAQNVDSKTYRKIVTRVFPELTEGVSGKIVMRISINKNGDVVYAEYLPSLSTVDNSRTIMSAIEAISKTKFEKNPEASEIECSQWTINIKSQY